MNYSFFSVINFFLFSYLLLGQPFLAGQDDFSVLNAKGEVQQELLISPSNCSVNDDCCCNSNATDNFNLWLYPNYLYLGHTEGKGLGYRQGFTTLGLFISPSNLWTQSIYPFLDAKCYCFNNGKFGSSVGIGERYLLPSCNVVLGANIYYDYRNVHHHDLNQIGLGFEILSPNLDLRFNGYIPVGKQNFRKKTLFDFSDGFLALRHKRTSAWSGMDAEVGTWLIKEHSCDWFGLYLAAGPYYYFRDHKKRDGNHKHAFGGRARLLARIYDIIDLSVSSTYDSIWHTGVQGQLAITIPLSSDCKEIFKRLRDRCCKCTPPPCLLQQLATQPVQRNGIIVADQDCCWQWNWNDCGCDCSGSSSSSHSTNRSSNCGCR